MRCVVPAAWVARWGLDLVRISVVWRSRTAADLEELNGGIILTNDEYWWIGGCSGLYPEVLGEMIGREFHRSALWVFEAVCPQPATKLWDCVHTNWLSPTITLWTLTATAGIVRRTAVAKISAIHQCAVDGLQFQFAAMTLSVTRLTIGPAQRRRHGFESGGQILRAKRAKIFLTSPLFGQWGDKIWLRYS